MTKRITVLFLLTCLLLTLLAGCNKALTREEAQKIAMDDMGVTASEVSSVDIHTTTEDGAVCYSVYITVGTEQTEYIIHGKTGEILHSGPGSHSH